MLVGIDFDNTVVCYDFIFHQVAVEKRLIPSHVPVAKGSVRDHMRRRGFENAWIGLQGEVYGPRMKEATPFPGVIDFFAWGVKERIPLRIISHRTRHPFQGEPYDLHEAAYDWLEGHGFFDPVKIGLPRDAVNFMLAKQDKLRRIKEAGCTHFIDDLPEFLSEPEFPASAARILFDPNDQYSGAPVAFRARAWADIQKYLYAEVQRVSC